MTNEPPIASPTNPPARNLPEGWERVWVGSGKAQARLIAGHLEKDGFKVRSGPGGDFETRGPRGYVVSVPLADAEQARLMLRKYGERAGLVEPLGEGSNWATLNNLFFVLLVLALGTAAVVIGVAQTR